MPMTSLGSRANGRGVSDVDAKSSGTILLADDDAGVRRLVRRVLEKSGFRVLEASNGAIAMALVDNERTRIDVLLTDVSLPGTSGQELARWLHARRPETRVLFMSGHDAQSVVRQGVRPSAFLQKPFSPPELTHKVREVLAAGEP